MFPPSPRSYNLGFTAGSLRPELARIVAECYLGEGDWQAAKERVLSSNLLQSRTRSSAVRLEHELRQRLQTLTGAQLVLLVEGATDDRAAMAWLAVLKHLVFVFDFTVEVLRDKLAARDPILRPSDYETFLERKSALHPELVRLSPSSRTKIRQVLLRMLVEAGLLGQGGASAIIQRPLWSPPVLREVAADDPCWLAGFLLPDAEIPSR